MIRITFLLLIGLVSACSTINSRQEGWPPELPPRDYFVTYYNQDQEHQKVSPLDTYLLWIRRFYEGWTLYPNGWLKTTNKLVNTVETSDSQIEARDKMMTIGRLVSAEWAKDDAYRIINTRMLSIWGGALQESINQEDQLPLVTRVLEDVNGLLSNQLSADIITAERYYADDEEDDFF